MILFWAICALLILVALAFVLPAVTQRSEGSQAANETARRDANIAVYRDQLSELDADLRNGIVSEEQYTQDREDIERRLLEDTAAATPTVAKPITASARTTAYALAIGLPLIAVIFYLQIGDPAGVTNAAATMGGRPSSAAPVAGERTQEQIEANVAALAKRLQSNPSDAQGWTMLARSYSSMERFGEAAGAYAKATELTPNDADLWAEFAFVSAMASGRKLEGRPRELINRALQIDPENAKALQLAGSAAFEAQEYQKAVDYWQRVLKQLPPGSDVARTLTSRIDEAKALASEKKPN